MRRIILLLTVAALMASMMVFSAVPAFAQFCPIEDPTGCVIWEDSGDDSLVKDDKVESDEGELKDDKVETDEGELKEGNKLEFTDLGGTRWECYLDPDAFGCEGGEGEPSIDIITE